MGPVGVSGSTGTRSSATMPWPAAWKAVAALGLLSAIVAVGQPTPPTDFSRRSEFSQTLALPIAPQTFLRSADDQDGAVVYRQALQLYRRSKTADATAEGFEKLLEQTSGKPAGDLRWFFDDWVYRDRGLPDLSIAYVAPRPAPGPGSCPRHRTRPCPVSRSCRTHSP